MGITDEILEHAMIHFGSAGVVADEGGAVLMLGLEHTPKVRMNPNRWQRNLTYLQRIQSD